MSNRWTLGILALCLTTGLAHGLLVSWLEDTGRDDLRERLPW
ncbi:hypothetical protein [Natrinema sp. DC36]|nr:hypothetical protein [Natrinema sp. DC36]